MTNSILLRDSAALPHPADSERAQHGRERWRDAAARGDPSIIDFARWMDTDPAGARLLDAIFGNSPFLGRCALQEIPFLRAVIETGPDAAFESTLANLVDGANHGNSADAIARHLRIARRRVALLTALCDMASAWPLDDVVARLSAFADTAIGQAVSFHLRQAAAAGAIILDNGGDPQHGSGLAVIAMGKLGAGELNYSSDIDLILLFDEEITPTDDPAGLQKAMVRLARNLMRTLDDQTRDGYVFRTDLRLRPDPASTPLAVSMRAAETYYESAGQNWERAAMIKARAVAGDKAAGNAFLDYLTPFVWRKNLDFAAIADIHSIKRQIHAHRGGDSIALRGHNIKLGRGGIREIEFFAQTQQLVWGGRDPSVRMAGTCNALRALAEAGHIGTNAATELATAYRFLRRVEHRLQMIDDRQTHVLPADDEAFAALATFLGYAEPEALERELEEAMRSVEQHYAHLFEEAPALSHSGNLVFTGSDDDPDTIATLGTLGFDDPRSVAAVVRGWHHGRYRATRNDRARQILTELMPALLAAFGRTGNPAAALMKFDEFLSRLPAGVQVFSLFHSNPGLIDLLAEIMGSAPRLADHLSHNADLFDAVLTAEFFDPLPDRAALTADLGARLARARDFQDVLDDTRRWTKDMMFRIGVQMLRNATDADGSGRALADIADSNIAVLQPIVERAFAERHGAFPAGGMAVVALGNLGGREMTTTSDLDLIFVYDDGGDGESIGGAKALAASHYYALLSQRLLNALTAPTAEGPLYEVDMRLRPSGNKGPIASSLEAFRAYQSSAAWTWEQMALTRARVVSGPTALRDAVASTIRAALTRRRDPATLLAEVADMRGRIAREHAAESIWNAKHVRGGLVDIEFIAQYLQLLHAAAHPDILAPNTSDALRRIGAAGLIEPATADVLVDAARMWRQVQALLRLTLDRGFDPAAAPPGLRDALAKAADAVDFAALEAKVHGTAARVHGLFRDLIGEPGEPQ